MSESFPIRLGGAAVLDAQELLRTRLLVTGNSGCGKSWLARVLIEAVASKIPFFVIDPEGEFVSLRERIDLVVVSADGGDLRPSVRTAGLLARRLLELSQSAVIDLYHLSLTERRAFVREFLTALMAAPKEHWHPLLVVIDEAHKLVPEQGREKGTGGSVATDSVITLLSQGRKRGFCTALLTQRLSKLHKDAAAECVNVLVGRTTLPLDVKSAASLLSMTEGDAEFLRKIPVGEWCGYGSAFVSDDVVVRFKAGPVKTTHPEGGQQLVPPAPSSKIRKVLAELTDLDEKVEAEENEVEALRTEVSRLLRGTQELASRENPAPYELEAAREEGRGEGFDEGWTAAEARLMGMKDSLIESIDSVTAQLQDVALGLPNGENKHAKSVLQSVARVERSLDPVLLDAMHEKRQRAKASSGIKRGAPWKLLAAMLQHPGKSSRERFCALAGISPGAGNTSNAWSELRGAGLIVDHPDREVEASDLARRQYGNKVEKLPTGTALLDYWHARLGSGAPGKLFGALRQLRGRPASRDTVCQMAGISPTAGNTSNAWSDLRVKGLIDDHPGKAVSLSTNLR